MNRKTKIRFILDVLKDTKIRQNNKKTQPDFLLLLNKDYVFNFKFVNPSIIICDRNMQIHFQI